MISIKNYPNNRDEFVGAEILMKFLHGRTSGVFSLEDSAAVTAKQNQMAVTVSDGYGWITDAQLNGCVWWVDAKLETGQLAELPIDPADSTLARIDRVIVEWTTTLYTELPVLKILKGRNSSNPQPPVLTNNTTTRQISLAQVRVNPGALKLTPADIRDERLDPAVCGLVTFDTDIDTSVMQKQFMSMLEQVDAESAAVLQAIQDELAQIVGGTGFDPTPVVAYNVSIQPELFQEYVPEGEEETGIHEELGYTFRAKVPIPNAISSMRPYLTFSHASLDRAGVGIINQYRCYDGGVCVYSDSVPAVPVLLLTAEFRKKVV